MASGSVSVNAGCGMVWQAVTKMCCQSQVYNLVRNQFGSVIVPPAKAHDHALKVGRCVQPIGLHFRVTN
jgi:hypothetical protein